MCVYTCICIPGACLSLRLRFPQGEGGAVGVGVLCRGGGDQERGGGGGCYGGKGWAERGMEVRGSGVVWGSCVGE